MQWLERVLPQRKRVAFMAPFVLLILVVGLHMVPFATIGDKTVVSGELSLETTTKFYPDTVVVEDYTVLVAETFAPFGGTTTETFEYEAYGDFLDEVEDVAENTENRIATLTMLMFLVAIVGLSTRGQPLDLHEYVNWRTVAGGVMALMAIVFFLLAKDIQTGFGNSIEESVEPLFDDEEITSLNEGTWGKAVFEESETTTTTFSWGPSWMYWFAVLGFFTGAIGAFAALSHLHPRFESEEKPVWPDGELPAWLTADHSTLWFGAVFCAVLVAVVAPWYSVDQTWIKSEEVGEVYTNSTYELGWTLSPFYAHFANDTGLFIGEEGEKESGFSGYNTMYELDTMAPILLSLRWPLILSAGLLGGWATTRFVGQVRERLNINEHQRNMLFAGAIVFVMMFSATADFERILTRNAEEDLRGMSPMLNSTFVHRGAQDTFSGQSFDSDFEFTGNAFIVTFAAMEWGPSWGYFGFSLLPWLGVGLLCSIGLPNWLERRQTDETKEPMFDADLWKAKPAMAMLVSVMLVSLLASFPPSSLGDGASAAPGSLSQWNLDYNYRGDGQYNEQFLEDGQTFQLTTDTDAQNFGNVTSVEFSYSCDEGQSGLLSDEPDEVDFTITPPGEVDTYSETLSGTLQCPSSGTFRVSSEVILPNDEYAATAEAYLSLIEIINPLGGTWTVEFTARTNSGGTALDADNELYFEMYYDFTGLDGFTAVEREE